MHHFRNNWWKHKIPFSFREPSSVSCRKPLLSALTNHSRTFFFVSFGSYDQIKLYFTNQKTVNTESFKPSYFSSTTNTTDQPNWPESSLLLLRLLLLLLFVKLTCSVARSILFIFYFFKFFYKYLRNKININSNPYPLPFIIMFLTQTVVGKQNN